MEKFINLPPIHDSVLKHDNKPTKEWQSWFDDVLRTINNHGFLYNDHLTVNPDFNWSRTKGNTPTVADGEFVEKWNVKANGMTFSITPTYYTSTQDSSLTGSERYVNVNITTVNSSDFIIYQLIPKKLSKFQGRKITLSAYIKNNDSNKLKAKFYIGFDLTGGGTDTYSAESKAVFVNPDSNEIFATIQCPKIDTDNQTNVITIAIKLFDLANPVDVDVYYIKPEISDSSTMLHVEHPLEKYKIDNP